MTVYRDYQKGSLMVPSPWDCQQHWGISRELGLFPGICSSLPPIKPSSSLSSSFLTTSLLPLFSFKPSLKLKKGSEALPPSPPSPLPTPSPPPPPLRPSSFSSLSCWCSLRCCCCCCCCS